MKKLLILPVLLLASCAPILQAVEGEKGSLSRDGASITLNNPGPGAMEEAVIRAEGPGLVLGAPCVARATTGVWGCVVGNVPEGTKYRLTPLSGSIGKASANFYRGANAIFTRLELP